MKRYQMLIVLLVTLASFGCGTSSDTSATSDGSEASSNIAESAMSTANSSSTASEGTSSPGFTALGGLDFELQNMNYVDPQDSIARPATACTFATARGSGCASNVSTIAWNGCTLHYGVLTGGWTETWTAGFCANGAQPGVLTTGNQVVRKTNPTQVFTVSTVLTGATLTDDTTAFSAYDGTAINGNGITVANSSGTRTITIDGLHRTLKGPHGTAWFDHALTGTLTATGTRAGANRVVSGSMTLRHNLAKYTAAHTFNSVTWGSASCCYPTSGTITSTLSGTKTGSTTMDFTAGATTCGQASFTDTNNTVTTVTLTQCN